MGRPPPPVDPSPREIEYGTASLLSSVVAVSWDVTCNGECRRRAVAVGLGWNAWQVGNAAAAAAMKATRDRDNRTMVSLVVLLRCKGPCSVPLVGHEKCVDGVGRQLFCVGRLFSAHERSFRGLLGATRRPSRLKTSSEMVSTRM